MYALSKAQAGDICTIKWMFGLPEAVDFLRQHHVEEGETIQVIRKLRDSLIIGAQNERVALGKEIADRIQVPAKEGGQSTCCAALLLCVMGPKFPTT